MHPLVRGAVAVAVLSALGSLAPPKRTPASNAIPISQLRGVAGLPAPCGPGTLPEGPVCLRVPTSLDSSEGTPNVADLRPSPQGERIPRQPDRPTEPAAYVFPVGPADRPPTVLEGFEEGPMWRRAPNERDGILLAARPEESIRVIALDHQEGPSEVRFTGGLGGRTIITQHTVTDRGRAHVYLLVYGRLGTIDAAATNASHLDPGASLGTAASSADGGLISVFLEARLVRDGVTLDGLDGRRLLDGSVSIPVDLRNVLPIRNGAKSP